MADDRNFLGVVGDIASNTGNALQNYQQSKLDARHKAHLDALAQRHAREQYDAQMRGLDIRERQALAQQHLAEVRESYNQSRLDQIDRQFGETERHNRAAEETAGVRAEKTNRPPDIVGKTRTGLMADVKDWRAASTPRPIGRETGDYGNERTIYGPQPGMSPTPPTLQSSGMVGVPSRLDLARQEAEYYGLPADSVEWRLTGQPTGQWGDRPTPVPRQGIMPAPRWGTIGTPMAGSYEPGRQGPPPNDGSLSPQEYEEYVALWRQKNGQ